MAPLTILAAAVHLPPARPVVDLVREAGGDPTGYRGWECVCIAGPDDHPSTMATRALESALARAGVAAGDLRIVISAGMSRDYPPSWSVAAEVMRLGGVPDTAIGLDITSGCLATLTGLTLLQGWLELEGGGVAAVVCAERWSQTADRSDTAKSVFWAHGDGAGAIVVEARSRTRPALGVFQGACYVSRSRMNGHVLIRYGGTRHPVAPPGVDSQLRETGPTPLAETRQIYEEAYGEAFAALARRFPEQPRRLVCNQITPGFVPVVREAAGMPEHLTVTTGHEYGHLGSVDLVAGLDRLTCGTPLTEAVALAASTPYAFGAGLLVPATP